METQSKQEEQEVKEGERKVDNNVKDKVTSLARIICKTAFVFELL